MEQDMNLVETWANPNPSRWIAGILAGLLAGVISLVFAGIISTIGGLEFRFPIKLAASIIVGSSATYTGMNLGVIIIGFVLYEVIAAFLGFVYAHFVFSNELIALLPMGLVWGVFSWIFIWNLFLQSFKVIFAAQISSGPVFPICLVFGISLASVAFFDRGRVATSAA